MAVYLIRAGENGPVKIGHSNDPEIRLGQLQVSHWETLRIIRQFEGGEAEEQMLHDRFADLYIRGEWHAFSRAMMGDVGLVEIFDAPEELPLPPVSVMVPSGAMGRSFGNDLRALRKSQGLTQEKLALLVGVSRVTIAMIEAGHDLPGRDLLLRISSHFGVPFTVSSNVEHV
jgi:DNA-binding XRE family transcriptional regulator